LEEVRDLAPRIPSGLGFPFETVLPGISLSPSFLPKLNDESSVADASRAFSEPVVPRLWRGGDCAGAAF
jgi:hypothetical protein